MWRGAIWPRRRRLWKSKKKIIEVGVDSLRRREKMREGCWEASRGRRGEWRELKEMGGGGLRWEVREVLCFVSPPPSIYVKETCQSCMKEMGHAGYTGQPELNLKKFELGRLTQIKSESKYSKLRVKIWDVFGSSNQVNFVWSSHSTLPTQTWNSFLSLIF